MPMYRQGDVLIMSVDLIPKSAKKQPKNGRIVLEYGEITNHAHAINDISKTDLYLDGTRKFLEICLAKSAAVTHEEHRKIELPKGKFEVRRQVTWSALQQMARVVAD